MHLPAGFNPLVLGEGITVPSSLMVYVLGGYQLPATEKEYRHATYRDSSIVVESGSWHAVVGFSRGGGTASYTGTSNITVNGGTDKSVYRRVHPRLLFRLLEHHGKRRHGQFALHGGRSQPTAERRFHRDHQRRHGQYAGSEQCYGAHHRQVSRR